MAKSSNSNKTKCIIVFSSSSFSMRLYKILKEARYKVDLISTPCTLSAGCSRAVKVNKDDLDEIKELIKEKKIKIKAIYEKILNGRRFYYKKMK